jgi:hypothetical protein
MRLPPLSSIMDAPPIVPANPSRVNLLLHIMICSISPSPLPNKYIRNIRHLKKVGFGRVFCFPLEALSAPNSPSGNENTSKTHYFFDTKLLEAQQTPPKGDKKPCQNPLFRDGKYFLLCLFGRGLGLEKFSNTSFAKKTCPLCQQKVWKKKTCPDQGNKYNITIFFEVGIFAAFSAPKTGQQGPFFSTLLGRVSFLAENWGICLFPILC